LTIIAAPVVDKTTDTVYFWAKGYRGQGHTVQGYQNGAYRFHAIDAATLAERPGFPTWIEGQHADNDATRYFTGGGVLQRPALNLINGVVYTGFGSHCSLFNYTGWLVGMRASDGSRVTVYSTTGGPNAVQEDGTWNGGGGGCSIWMGGSPVTSDHAGRLFFATGNAVKATVNGLSPANGRQLMDTLSESIVMMNLDANGVATQGDYFEPFNYRDYDNGDKDVGSSGVSLLPFTGNGVTTMAVTCGKMNLCYVTNAGNLGGYKLGTGGTGEKSFAILLTTARDN
jgi:hypothetical protein